MLCKIYNIIISYMRCVIGFFLLNCKILRNIVYKIYLNFYACEICTNNKYLVHIK